jgi:hypothetical protein
MAKIREEIAVQKAKETELNKTIHITGWFESFDSFIQFFQSNYLVFAERKLMFPSLFNRGNYESKTSASNNVARDKITTFWCC